MSTEWKGGTVIVPTDDLKEYMKNLERQICAYQKKLEKERKEHEEWLKKLRQGIHYEQI